MSDTDFFKSRNDALEAAGQPFWWQKNRKEGSVWSLWTRLDLPQAVLGESKASFLPHSAFRPGEAWGITASGEEVYGSRDHVVSELEKMVGVL